MTRQTHRILVTNDDGVSSPGLGVLARHLADDGHDVIVAAPAAEASGSGAAIGAVVSGDTVTTERVELPDAPGITAFSVDGAPGRCVLVAAIGGFGPPPELVVSGINPGANVGNFAQLHSGTLGAALTAAGVGIRGMAVSLDATEPAHWSTAATVATRLVDYLAGCQRRTTLNLNLPDLPLGELNGIRTAMAGSSGAQRLVISGAPPGVLTFEFVRSDPSPNRPDPPGDTERSLLDTGFAALTRVAPPTRIEPEPLPPMIV
jgi:5'-nucleotidase